MSTIPNPLAWRDFVKAIPGARRAARLNDSWEEWWFDAWYGVNTSTDIEKQEILGWPEDKLNFHYIPTRPRHARRLFRHLPLTAREEYTFIDFGSGKGRMLFLAALHGFRHVCGIELRQALHERALENFCRCRHVDGCIMESFRMDATDFQFPNQKLVIFFFNPFGREVLQRVLANLGRSLEHRCRDVWVIFQNPTPTSAADQNPQLRLCVSQREFQIYRSAAPARHGC